MKERERILESLPTLPGAARIKERARRVSFSTVVSQAFTEVGIRLNISGNVERFSGTGTSALLMGDHRSGLERIPLLAVLGQIGGRDDVRFVALPHAFEGKITKDLHPNSEDWTLPVMPQSFARDSTSTTGEGIIQRPIRDLRGSSSLTTAEIQALNEHTFTAAADLLASGYAVNVYPAGVTQVDIQQPWRGRGIGEILSQVPLDLRRELQLVPYRFGNDYSKYELLGAFWEKEQGSVPPDRTFTFVVGDVKTALEVIHDATDPRKITELLQRYYLSAMPLSA